MAKMKPRDPWVRIFKLAGDRKAKHVEIITWVSDNIDRKLYAIKSVPSPAAATLLKCVRASGSRGIAVFFKDQWIKAFPTTRALEAEARFNDDGRSIEKLIDDFHADDADRFHFPVLPSGAQGPAGQPVVPPPADSAVPGRPAVSGA